jgi:alkaline phosphatase D
MKSNHQRSFDIPCPLATSLAALLALPLAASAQFTTPHLSNVTGDVTNVLGSTVFINHGLVGVGHISASALDTFGESFGSCSSMQITGWTTNGDGSYSGTLNVLPDRGYNSGNFYADYAARINQVGFTFWPYYGSTNIGGTTDLEKLDAQTNQLAFGAISGVRFTYYDPNTGSNSFTTGLDPGTNSTTLFGKTMPYVTTYTGYQSPSSTSNTTYTGVNKLPLDSEALILKPDGSGYVGDEYGENIYYFNSAKVITDAIVPPVAMQPHSPTNVLNYTSATTPLNGRRNNQGFEGVSLSPDGTRLFALQQSACVQDSDAGNNQNARNTRLLIYDVSTNPVPANPLAEYALTLPTYRDSGNGSSANKTCAQSEVVALDNHRFLVLPRDGNGLGNSVTNPNVYKTVILVDTTVGTPTNFAGDAAKNAEGGKITTSSGVLNPAVTPLNWVEVVNILNTNQLAKFNVQWDSGTGQVSKLTMGEKWEGLALVAANDPNNPNDYFLFVGNDNDFLTSNGRMKGPDGTIVSYNGFAGYPASRLPAPLDSAYSENDTRILAFRLTIEPSLQFPQSVASGDPTPNAVILWTRAVPGFSTTNDCALGVQVADSPSFANVVFQRTNLLARYAFDYCVKVLATNLSPYTTYYYRFSGPGPNNYSPVGRTKTAPAPDQAVSARFAVLNCQDYIGHYYNTLAHLVLNESNKCDFVVHVGDYIYETTGDPSFQATNGARAIVFDDLAGARQLGTPAAPFYAAASLDNYRQLLRTYTSDPNLLRVRELFPMINIWDDHEYANDCWGATSTDFNGKTNEYNLTRRHNAEQAFLEYLPINIGLDNQGVQIDSSILYPNAKIYRNIQYGSLLDIFLTDYRSYHPAELVPMDAFPATVAMDEPTCSFVVGAGWPYVRSSFDPYVNIDDPTNAVLKATLQAVATGAYQAEGLLLADAQARAVGAVVGNLSGTYINGLMQGASLPAPFSSNQLAGMPRGLSFLLMGKQQLFTSFGARYLIARLPFQLYAGYLAYLNPTLQNAWGATQTSELVATLSTNTARWKLVADSVSFVPTVFDFANPPVPLPTNFPSQLRTQLQLNADDWDGMPNGSQAILTQLASLGAVVFSGDIHAGFVMSHSTANGVVPEFTAPAISSESFRDELSAQAHDNPITAGLPGLDQLIAATDVLLKDGVTKTGLGALLETYTDANGYLILEATPDNLQAEFHLNPSYQATNDLTGDISALNAASSSTHLQVVQGGGGLAIYSTPTISQSVISAGNLILTGAAGTAGGTYSVLTSTDLAAPLALWTTNSAGTFDSNGLFTNSIPLGGADNQRFFLIKQP